MSGLKLKLLKAALAAKVKGTYELEDLIPLFPEGMATAEQGNILQSLHEVVIAPGVLFQVSEDAGVKHYKITRLAVAVAVAAKPGNDQSNKLTMTLPAAVMAALEAAGKPLDMTGQEWLKHQVIAAYTQEAGVHMKLEKVTVAADPNQLTLGFEANKA